VARVDLLECYAHAGGHREVGHERDEPASLVRRQRRQHDDRVTGPEQLSKVSRRVPPGEIQLAAARRQGRDARARERRAQAPADEAAAPEQHDPQAGMAHEHMGEQQVDHGAHDRQRVVVDGVAHPGGIWVVAPLLGGRSECTCWYIVRGPDLYCQVQFDTLRVDGVTTDLK